MKDKINKITQQVNDKIIKRIIYYKLFILMILTPTFSFAACNHFVVDSDPRFACVTVVNHYYKSIVVTGEPGVYLNPGDSEETMLLPGAWNIVQATPNPYSPNEKQLSCKFKVYQAKESNIVIIYADDTYDVKPSEFKNNCKLEKKSDSK